MDWFTIGILLVAVVLNVALAAGSLWGGSKLLAIRNENGRLKAVTALLGLALLALSAYCLLLLYRLYRFMS